MTATYDPTDPKYFDPGALREEIDRQLTPWQRHVFVAITLNNVPIDVLAQRLNTTRGALYKTLHDARHRLRAGLAARALDGSDEELSSSSDVQVEALAALLTDALQASA